MMNILPGLLLFVVPLLSPLERGDREFVRMNYPLAGAIYDSVLTASADSVDALWRLARVYVCMADVSPQDEKLDLYRQAESFAHRCIQADSMKAEGHTWRAAALETLPCSKAAKQRSDSVR